MKDVRQDKVEVVSAFLELLVEIWDNVAKMP